MKQQLIFIYNANSGTTNLIIDAAHKIVSPSTYQCSLCELTFGAFRERKAWKEFRKELELKGFVLDFLHKDEFSKTYNSKFGHKFTFPIILVIEGGQLAVMVNTEEMNVLKTSGELINLLRQRV